VSRHGQIPTVGKRIAFGPAPRERAGLSVDSLSVFVEVMKVWCSSGAALRMSLLGVAANALSVAQTPPSSLPTAALPSSAAGADRPSPESRPVAPIPVETPAAASTATSATAAAPEREAAQPVAFNASRATAKACSGPGTPAENCALVAPPAISVAAKSLLEEDGSEGAAPEEGDPAQPTLIAAVQTPATLSDAGLKFRVAPPPRNLSRGLGGRP
jgi:hypothetical protein